MSIWFGLVELRYRDERALLPGSEDTEIRRAALAEAVFLHERRATGTG